MTIVFMQTCSELELDNYAGFNFWLKHAEEIQDSFFPVNTYIVASIRLLTMHEQCIRK